MVKKGLQIILVIFSIIIGLYPTIYFLVDWKFGLLSSKSEELLINVFWNTSFYIHIILGGLALLVGWTQFSLKIRERNIALHRLIGKFYVIAVLLSAIGGIYIAFFATGGLVASLGFISLGLVWFYTTLMAYIDIRKMRIVSHEKMMIYSYAACFAAVTLRIWLPILTMALGDFTIAYRVVAWLCWVPNLGIAYWIVDKKVK